MPKRAADDGDASASSKKKAKQDTDASDSPPDGQLSKDGEGNYYLDLGKMKRATISVFKGNASVNIREYYADKASGEAKPGKKGISLNKEQWTALSSAVATLSEQLETAQAGATSESGKGKKAGAEKATKAKPKKSEKPAKKKKKKEESEDEAEAEESAED